MDLLMCMDAALILLHEAKHAELYFARGRQGLYQHEQLILEDAVVREHTTGILNAYGGQTWQDCVQREVDTIKSDLPPEKLIISQSWLAWSPSAHPELGRFLGKTLNPWLIQQRSKYVIAAANVAVRMELGQPKDEAWIKVTRAFCARARQRLTKS